MPKRDSQHLYVGRNWVVLAFITLAMVAMMAQAVYLQVVTSDELNNHGVRSYVREMTVPAKRGMVLDRHGEPLAVSTPVDSIAADPRFFSKARANWPQLAELIGISTDKLAALHEKYANRRFMYLRRHLSPQVGRQVKALRLPGVMVEREYRRFYPLAAATGHIVGFTNIDDKGLEGVELVANSYLAGSDGRKRVLRDGDNNIIENLNLERPAQGKDVVLSIDTRIQHEAVEQLNAAIDEHKAKGGSLVALDVRTGEVLAMVNLPDFDPNYRGKVLRSHLRNRAVTDTFEPGSTIKPFAVAMALEAGTFSHNTVIDTEGGDIKVSGRVVRDHHDYGDLTVSQVLIKSSNVGVTKIALAHEPKSLVHFLSQLGVGQVSKVGLPGEVAGRLNKVRKWRPIERATLSFGYGLSVTTLQLARLYATVARGGELIALSIFRRDGYVTGERVYSRAVASQLAKMLEQVVSKKGTGQLAKVPLYRVAGKTGTTQKLVDGRYVNDRHRSLFAGFAPVSNPRIAIAVMIDEPSGEKYYGGHVAAPVFREVMTTALRLMNIAPDDATFEETKPEPRDSGTRKLMADGTLAANTEPANKSVTKMGVEQ